LQKLLNHVQLSLYLYLQIMSFSERLPNLSKLIKMCNCSLIVVKRGRKLMTTDPRGERLQIMLTKHELTSLDSWRFSRHMPSRAAAVRELLRRGLSAEGFAVSDGSTKSGDFGVISGAVTRTTKSGNGAARTKGGATARAGE
jgi:hypothetical protein